MSEFVRADSRNLQNMDIITILEYYHASDKHKVACKDGGMLNCCPCGGGARSAPGDPAVPGGGAGTALPLICLVPRATTGPKETDKESISKPQQPTSENSDSDFKLLDEDYIKKHFKLPPRALYLDPFRRPLITFPLNQEQIKNFTMARKNKINQQILDGFLHPSAAISAPSVFPYAKPKPSVQAKDADEDEEIIYILQLPDWEFTCPAHNQPIRTPRFLWHSVKKTKEKDADDGSQQGGGPLNKPKPWLLSRHTDFDLSSQW